MNSKTLALDAWLARILDKDASTFENAYWGQRPEVTLAIPRLIELLKTTHDSYSRGKILELLGECGDKKVEHVISEDLNHNDEQVRQWAQNALSALHGDTPWQQKEWQ